MTLCFRELATYCLFLFHWSFYRVKGCKKIGLEIVCQRQFADDVGTINQPNHEASRRVQAKWNMFKQYKANFADKLLSPTSFSLLPLEARLSNS